MESFKEFNGKDIDTVINEACAYFDTPREKLEIEIIQDAKSGIFGIVGARKAKIRARRAPLRETVQNLLGKKNVGKLENSSHANKSSYHNMRVRDENAKKITGHPAAKEKPLERPAHDNSIEHDTCKENDKLNRDRVDEIEESYNSIETLEPVKLKETIKKIVGRLAEPVAGQKIDVEAEIRSGRIYAHINWTGDAGLIIGREGQTLEAMEYLASRMISHAMNTGLRIQLDIGEYRSRQEDKLRQIAKILADKALHTGRPYSTRPLSSYHRRIIHIYLQGMPEIVTRSAGEGHLKRVVISARRPIKA